MISGQPGKPDLIIYALLSITAAALVAVSFGAHMGVDEAMWNYMSRGWLEGRPIYSHSIDNKPPGIFAVYATCIAAGGTTVWLPRLAGTAATVAALFMLYLTGRRLGGPGVGLLSVPICGLAMGWAILDGPYAAQTEPFMILPALAAVWALLRARQGQQQVARRWIVFAGLMLGTALSFKQVALFSVMGWGVLYLAMMHKHRPARQQMADIAAAGAACLAMMAAWIVPVLASGPTFGDYWFNTWLLPLLPGTGNASLQDRLVRFVEVFFRSPMILFYLPLAVLVWRRKQIANTLNAPLWALVAWAGLELTGAAASGYFYGHQVKQVLPTLSLLAAAGLGGALEWLRPARASQSGRPLIIALAAAVLLWMPYAEISAAFDHKPDPNREMGDFVRQNSQPSDYVVALGWDGFQILAWSQRPSPCKYFSMFFLEQPAARQTLQRDLAAKPPRFIILPFTGQDQPNWQCVYDMLRRYEPIYTDGRYTIFEQL